MKRGTLVTAVFPGELGKPRPALVIQSEHFADHPSITLVPITSELRNAPLVRVTIEPDEQNALRILSQAMIDKVNTVSVGKLGNTIGHLDDRKMLQVNRALALFLGIA